MPPAGGHIEESARIGQASLEVEIGEGIPIGEHIEIGEERLGQEEGPDTKSRPLLSQRSGINRSTPLVRLDGRPRRRAESFRPYLNAIRVPLAGTGHAEAVSEVEGSK